jgi:hypothetical protein
MNAVMAFVFISKSCFFNLSACQLATKQQSGRLSLAALGVDKHAHSKSKSCSLRYALMLGGILCNAIIVKRNHVPHVSTDYRYSTRHKAGKSSLLTTLVIRIQSLVKI